MIKADLKSLLYRAGLYAPARFLYRWISRPARHERTLARHFYAELVEPGALCFDIGANVGQTTEALLDCGARVIAVEPNPLCLPVLRWQFGRDSRVTVVPQAVGREPGTAVLNFSGTESTASIRDDWLGSNREAVSVQVTTLDELIGRFGRPALCKVDVEGFETEVFSGLGQPLPVICFEIHRQELDRARQALQSLSRLGRITAMNMTQIDNSGWAFDQWVSFDQFLEGFEAKLSRASNVVLKMQT